MIQNEGKSWGRNKNNEEIKQNDKRDKEKNHYDEKIKLNIKLAMMIAKKTWYRYKKWWRKNKFSN